MYLLVSCIIENNSSISVSNEARTRQNRNRGAFYRAAVHSRILVLGAEDM